LERGHGLAASDVAAALRAFLDSQNVVANNSAVEAGLILMDAGGDFADGAIAHEGMELGAEIFLSFDKAAVRRLTASGNKAHLLS
jgi:predicted nucleic-acid-binding protein